MYVKLHRGLNLRFGGEPQQRILRHAEPQRIALMPAAYRGLRPKLLVSEGDVLACGQAVAADQRHPDMLLTTSRGGRVQRIVRGERRRVLRIEIESDGTRRLTLPGTTVAGARLGEQRVREVLLASGLWLALRARPFEQVASPDIQPRAVFVTAIDTNPLAPDPAAVLADRHADFEYGVRAIGCLSAGDTFVCVAAGSSLPVPEEAGILRCEFAGPHPAGLPGTHLHAVGPAPGPGPDLWHVGYQEVATLGGLLRRGEVDANRVISVAGPSALDPGLVSTAPGAKVSSLLGRNAQAGLALCGSPLLARGSPEFLGPFDAQLSLVGDGRLPQAGGLWQLAVSRLESQWRNHAPGGGEGMLPLESFERVWPFRTPAAAVLRSILIGDPDELGALGALALAEEDLALCSLICPAALDYGTALRRALDRCEQGT